MYKEFIWPNRRILIQWEWGECVLGIHFAKLGSGFAIGVLFFNIAFLWRPKDESQLDPNKRILEIRKLVFNTNKYNAELAIEYMKLMQLIK